MFDASYLHIDGIWHNIQVKHEFNFSNYNI